MTKPQKLKIINIIEINGVEYLMDDLPEEQRKEVAYQLTKKFITTVANMHGYEVVEKIPEDIERH